MSPQQFIELGLNCLSIPADSGIKSARTTSASEVFAHAEKESRMYIAMNRLKVKKGAERDFEQVWLSRETHLENVPGFIVFYLLKGPEREDIAEKEACWWLTISCERTIQAPSNWFSSYKPGKPPSLRRSRLAGFTDRKH